MKIMSVTFRPVVAINLSTVQKILAQLQGPSWQIGFFDLALTDRNIASRIL